MLTFDELCKRANDGATQVASVQGIEKENFQVDLAVMAEMLIRDGSAKNLPVGDLVSQALIMGLALGLQLTIQNGEVKGR